MLLFEARLLDASKNKALPGLSPVDVVYCESEQNRKYLVQNICKQDLTFWQLFSSIYNKLKQCDQCQDLSPKLEM